MRDDGASDVIIREDDAQPVAQREHGRGIDDCAVDPRVLDRAYGRDLVQAGNRGNELFCGCGSRMTAEPGVVLGCDRAAGADDPYHRSNHRYALGRGRRAPASLREATVAEPAIRSFPG